MIITTTQNKRHAISRRRILFIGELTIGFELVERTMSDKKHRFLLYFGNAAARYRFLKTRTEAQLDDGTYFTWDKSPKIFLDAANAVYPGIWEESLRIAKATTYIQKSVYIRTISFRASFMAGVYGARPTKILILNSDGTTTRPPRLQRMRRAYTR